MFFSVNVTLSILGKNYVPCVCYELKPVLKETIKKLQAEGEAEIYDHKVYFQSGMLLQKTAKTKKTSNVK